MDGLISYSGTGFHGCDSSHSQSIMENNWWCSGENRQLGSGAYFFVEGLCENPVWDAKQWAVARSTRAHIKYSRLSVMSAHLKSERIWDLDSNEGRRDLNTARAMLCHKIDLPLKGNQDGPIISFVAKTKKYEATKGSIFLASSVDTEGIHLRGGVPNTSILCVHEPDSVIDRNSITVHLSEDIPPQT